MPTNGAKMKPVTDKKVMPSAISALLQPNSASSGPMKTPSEKIDTADSDMPSEPASTTVQFDLHSATAPPGFNSPSNIISRGIKHDLPITNILIINPAADTSDRRRTRTSFPAVAVIQPYSTFACA